MAMNTLVVTLPLAEYKGTANPILRKERACGELCDDRGVVLILRWSNLGPKAALGRMLQYKRR